MDICDLNRPWLRADREDRERLVRTKAFQILVRLEHGQDVEDLLEGPLEPFSLYINLRLEQLARAVHAESSRSFEKAPPTAGEAEDNRE